jgi:glycosyltransferase involved in cell wall biosynthesis
MLTSDRERKAMGLRGRQWVQERHSFQKQSHRYEQLFDSLLEPPGSGDRQRARNVNGIMVPKRPIRVCFMIDRLSTAGTETQLLALIRNLDRARVQPSLCLLDGHDPASRSMEPGRCPTLRLGVRALHHPSTLVKALRLGRFLRQQRIDILQVYFKDSSYLGIPVALLAGVKRVVRTRNNLGYWIKPLDRWLGWLCHFATDVILTNCAACRQAVIRNEGASPKRVGVLENGVDLQHFQEQGAYAFLRNESRSKSQYRVGIVANLRSVKNLDLLIRAAADLILHLPEVTFHIAGEGEQEQNLKQLVQDLGLTGRVFFHGSVGEIPAFLVGLDVAVLCSRSEGMSNALLEYMAAGKAIVATGVGGCTELIEDNVHGLLVPAEDPARLAGAIRQLLRQPGLRRRLGQAARKRVHDLYGREAMVRRFENFYQELMESGRP